MKSLLSAVFAPLALCSWVATGAEPDFPAWLRGEPSSLRTVRDTECCTLLWRAPMDAFSGVLVSPDTRRYAVLSRTSNDATARVSVKVFVFGSPGAVLVHAGGEKPDNLFCPIGTKWAPDSDQLFVKYGYRDLGVGSWIPHDPQSGKMIGHEKLYRKLLETKLSERPRAHRFQPPTLVWTLGGKQFGSARAAHKEGYTALYSPPRRQPDYAARVLWTDGTTYRVLMDPRGDGSIALVFVEDKIVDRSVKAVQSIHHRVLFTYKDGDLRAKILPQLYAPPVTVDFGKRTLEWVTDLYPQRGLLIQSNDGKSRYWQLLDRRKLRDISYRPKAPPPVVPAP